MNTVGKLFSDVKKLTVESFQYNFCDFPRFCESYFPNMRNEKKIQQKYFTLDRRSQYMTHIFLEENY